MLYRGAAGYYARYRPGYPPELFELLVERFALDGRGRLLDLACGTGHLSFPLADRFEEVVALDAEPDMLAEAARAAPPNVRLIEGRAEEIDAILGTFRLATIGTAFHWLERRVVLDRLDPLARGLAIVGASQPPEGEFEWWDACQDVVRAFLGPSRRAGTKGFFEHSGESWSDVLAASPFGRPEEHELVVERTWKIDDVVGLLHSTSYASPQLLGDRIGAFDDVLRARLAEFEQPFRERVVFDAHLCIR